VSERTDGTGSFQRLRRDLAEIQTALRESGIDGWLLYDMRARNKVAGGMLGLGELSRRWFVLIPAEGEPHAVTHGIEQGPWEAWPWKKERYSAWRELDRVLGGLLAGRRTVAMEVMERDAVPIVDLVPAGVVELIRGHGVDVVSSANLVTRFYSRWDDAGLASHRRAAQILAATARDAFAHLADRLRAGEEVTEAGLRTWVLKELARRGAGAGADCIVANGPNAANPHYEPGERGAVLGEGDVVLLDLWAKETEDSIYADQTWMAYVGERVPDRVAELFAIIRDGRDAAVEFLRAAWKEGREVQGWEVDDVTRRVVTERGYGEHFFHRTGHSIDRAVHGMGPNIDNLETHETRLLLPGVGFSIEPGIYLPGDIGLRTEIDVYIGEDGPEVTTPGAQSEVFAVLAR